MNPLVIADLVESRLRDLNEDGIRARAGRRVSSGSVEARRWGVSVPDGLCRIRTLLGGAIMTLGRRIVPADIRPGARRLDGC